MLLDDRTAAGPGRQLHSIAHGVISLEFKAPDYGKARRELQVLKFRGSDFAGGGHEPLLVLREVLTGAPLERPPDSHFDAAAQ